MPWTIELCVYKENAKTDVGHAFVTVLHDGRVSTAAGLSPGRLPQNALKKLLCLIHSYGKVYAEFDSLDRPNLRTRSWDITEQQAINVHNRINEDRRKNVIPAIPDQYLLPAHEITENYTAASENYQEWAGGPDYALFWSNCASYALELIEVAGIDTRDLRQAARVYRPSVFYDMLEPVQRIV